MDNETNTDPISPDKVSYSSLRGAFRLALKQRNEFARIVKDLRKRNIDLLQHINELEEYF